MGSNTARIPAWVTCDRTQLRDFHTVAYRRADRTRDPRAIGMLHAIDWVVGCDAASPIRNQDDPVTEQAAYAELAAAAGMPRDNTWAVGAGEALAYLLGLATRPPLQVPRRNPDGSLVSWEQLYAEREAAAPLRWEPEQAAAEEDRARRDAARWASLV